MNRNTFLKKFLAFVGIATATAAVTTLKSEAPTPLIDGLI